MSDMSESLTPEQQWIEFSKHAADRLGFDYRIDAGKNRIYFLKCIDTDTEIVTLTEEKFQSILKDIISKVPQ